jgi:hypothetical protein
MARIEEFIGSLNDNIMAKNSEVFDGWEVMMSNASVRGVMVMRLQIIKLLNALKDGKSTKAQRRKLNQFTRGINAIAQVELNSKNYTFKICKPTNELKEEFKVWIKESLSKVLDEDQIKYILKKAKKQVVKELEVVVDNTVTEATEESEAA